MPPIKKINSRILDEAHRLVNICKHLDFRAIARHESLAVAQLQQAIQTLGIRVRGRISGDVPVTSMPIAKSNARQHESYGIEETIQAALISAGFEDRLGKIYNSESKQRMVAFSEVTQRSGLPAFLFAIAPDFAPVAGYHGIFVTPSEVYAAVYPVNGNGQWQIDGRRSYASMQQMEEWVTLLSAGFALP
jgi:hypothetical protein